MKKEENIRQIIEKYLTGKSSREELFEAISYFKDTGQNQTIESLLDEMWRKNQFSIPGEYESKDIPEILRRIQIGRAHV